MRFRHAAQQHFYPGGIQLLDLREIEYKLRAIGDQERLHIAQKLPRGARVQPFRHAFYHYGPAIGVHISSLRPGLTEIFRLHPCRTLRSGSLRRRPVRATYRATQSADLVVAAGMGRTTLATFALAGKWLVRRRRSKTAALGR